MSRRPSIDYSNFDKEAFRDLLLKAKGPNRSQARYAADCNLNPTHLNRFFNAKMSLPPIQTTLAALAQNSNDPNITFDVLMQACGYPKCEPSKPVKTPSGKVLSPYEDDKILNAVLNEFDSSCMNNTNVKLITWDPKQINDNKYGYLLSVEFEKKLYEWLLIDCNNYYNDKKSYVESTAGLLYDILSSKQFKEVSKISLLTTDKSLFVKINDQLHLPLLAVHMSAIYLDDLSVKYEHFIPTRAKPLCFSMIAPEPLQTL